VDEIEFRVVKALFSLNVDTIIEEQRINDEKLQVNDTSVENATQILADSPEA